MFNWLRKPYLAMKESPKLVESAIQGGDDIIQPAISKSEDLKNQGNVHLSNGNLEEAAECYRQAIVLNSSYAEAYVNLGLVFYKQGNPEGAVALYRKAIYIKPSLFQAHQYLGITLMNLGQSDAAEECFRRVISLVPENAAATQYLGVFAAERGDYPHAEVLLRRALELQPDCAEAHNNLGSLFMNIHCLPDAEASCRRAIELRPDYAEAYFNLGNVLLELRQLDDSAANFRHALEIKPDFAEAHNHLGITLKAMGQLDEAELCYRRALQIKPDYAEACVCLGNLFMVMGRPDDEAEACFRNAILMKPDYAEAYGALGNILRAQNRGEEALACFQKQFSLTPDNGEAQHHIASLSGNNTERAPIQYVEKLFDDYADKFDEHLQQILKYDIPKKLAALIAQHSTPPVEKWKVLDLGCGTGLVGMAIAPFAQQLVGVDLSSRMLEKAKARNIYQRLECMDLLVMMQDEKAACYDVIIAADVFIYLGKLDEIINEIKRLLCPGGLFAFSIEALGGLSNEEAFQREQQEYQLEKSGRYSQSPGYLARLASANGFLPQAMEKTQVRLENYKPINGYVALWKN